MKIHHLLDHPSIAITNEEQSFIRNHHSQISLSSLREREIVIAQNLVRKGVFTITKDNKNIVIKRGQDSNRSII
jgi:hypothetical protein